MSNRDKFKIGDRVRVINVGYCHKMLGTINRFGSLGKIEVILDGGYHTVWALEDSLELVTLSINFDRNKHKDTMLAWVNGSEIERYDDSCNTWWIDADPKFETDVEYRVKRKVEVFKYKFAKYQGCDHPIIVTYGNYSYIENHYKFIHWIGDEVTVEYPED